MVDSSKLKWIQLERRSLGFYTNRAPDLAREVPSTSPEALGGKFDRANGDGWLVKAGT